MAAYKRVDWRTGKKSRYPHAKQFNFGLVSSELFPKFIDMVCDLRARRDDEAGIKPKTTRTLLTTIAVTLFLLRDLHGDTSSVLARLGRIAQGDGTQADHEWLVVMTKTQRDDHQRLAEEVMEHWDQYRLELFDIARREGWTDFSRYRPEFIPLDDEG